MSQTNKKDITLNGGSYVPPTSTPTQVVQPTTPQNDYWTQIQNMANYGNFNGKGLQAVNQYQDRYNQMLNAYNSGKDTLSEGQQQTALTYLKNAKADVDSAQSYYDEYNAQLNASTKAKSQQYMAEQNAYKYMQQQLNASGLGGQGIAESTRAGIANAYQGALGGINQQMLENQNNLFKSYMDAINNNKLNNLTAELEGKKLDSDLALQNAQTENTKAQNEANTLSEYSSTLNGIKDIDSAKQYLEANKNNMSQNTYQQLVNELNERSENEFVSIDKLDLGQSFNKQVEALKNNSSYLSKLKNNTIIKIINDNGSEEYLEYSEGKFKKALKEAYKSSKEKMTIQPKK